MRVTVDSHTEARWSVVAATGEVDLSSVPAVRQAINDQLAAGKVDLLLDLTEVTFLDSTGLGVLVGAAKRARACGGSLALVCDNARILRLLRITGLDRTLPVFADVASATVGPAPAPA